MKFKEKIVSATFLKRKNRFIGIVKSKNKNITVHIPNTGSLKSVLSPPQPCRIRYFENTNRKIPWSLEMLKTKTSWVGVNTHLANSLIKEAWESKQLWSKYPCSQGEISLPSGTRLDRVFWKEKSIVKISKESFHQMPLHFVEVKNVSFKIKNQACFPDAVTLRGQKHLEELKWLLEQGHSCEMVYVVQREDCKAFAPADEVDPDYGKKLRQAFKKGLQISAFPCQLKRDSIKIMPKRLPIKL